jgi:malonyl CoA-acyl carrier protein transacylase
LATDPSVTPDRKQLLKSALVRIDELEARLRAQTASREPLAIVGMACRLPGRANSPEEFWDVLRSGTDAIVEVPRERFDIDEVYDPEPGVTGKTYSRHGGFIDDVDAFDAKFFGISPREAATMDPQQRLLLETSWTALENAGLASAKLAGSSTGVFVGLAAHDYSFLRIQQDEVDTYFGAGVAHSIAVGRISYAFGLHGPALAVDTACSSALVAVHLACQSLRAGECTTALAGGVNLILSPMGMVVASQGRMLSPEGRCKTFDQSADGYVRAEGCGMIVLKRLSDALKDNDRVLAVVRATASNQDGRSNGLTAPNGRAQDMIMRQALTEANLSPAEIDYVETHGTGTSLGDPIEVLALADVHSTRPADRPLILGSVKSNIGHLEAAAGIAGLLKVVLALEHEEIPKTLHVRTLNPNVPWADLPVSPATEARSWPRGERPRRAGLSSFGFSGTNVHMIIEEAPLSAVRAVADERPSDVLTVSARTPEGAARLGELYARHLREAPGGFHDVCFTANTGRLHQQHRIAVIAPDAAHAATSLEAFAGGKPEANVIAGTVGAAAAPRVAFLFTGQGSQYAGMGAELYRVEPIVRRTLDRCDELLRDELPSSLLSVMFEDGAALNETRYTQPALFALEYAIAMLWREWGIQPSIVLGHSLGEFVAATVAGVMTMEAGLRLAAARGRLMQTLSGDGLMSVILTDEAQVTEAIRGYADEIAIAALNAPEQVVVAGTARAVEAVERHFADRKIRVNRLPSSRAFHSPLMAPVTAPFRALAGAVTFKAPSVDVVSNVSGQLWPLGVAPDADYWTRHLRAPVRFGESMRTLSSQQVSHFVEIGPGSALLGLGKQTLGETGRWLPSIRRGQSEWSEMLRTLATLHVAGVEVAWTQVGADSTRRRVALPTYPFERQRFPIPSVSADRARRSRPTGAHPLLGEHLSVAGDAVMHVWDGSLSLSIAPYMADHHVQGTQVVPGTVFVELVHRAAHEAFGEGPIRLAGISFTKPLMLTGEECVRIQVVVTGPSPDSLTFRVSRIADTGTWTEHVSGRLERGAAPRAETDLSAVKSIHIGSAAAAPPMTGDEFYNRSRQRGNQWGPTFQGVVRIWRGENEALSEIVVPSAIASAMSGYLFHPAVADACMHGLMETESDPQLGPARQGGGWVGSGVDEVRLFRRARGPRLWAYARRRADQPDPEHLLVGDVTVFDEEGEVVSQAVGVKLWFMKEALAPSRSTREQAPAGGVPGLYDLRWMPAPENGTSATDASGTWLVLSGQDGVGPQLSAWLEARGGRPIVVPGGGSSLPARLAAALDDERLVTNGLRGVVHLWSLDSAAGPNAASEAVTGLLDAVQSMDRLGNRRPEVFAIVTRGSQAAGRTVEGGGLAGAALWGFGRALASEQPDLGVRLIDLDPDGESDIDRLGAEILRPNPDGEQVSLRGADRLALRLVDTSAETTMQATPFELGITTRGVLDNLMFEPASPAPPGDDEVQIRVRASGMNFRDVLNALGMYPDPSLPPLGSECVGDITAVGKNVASLRVGQRVMAMTNRGFSTFAIAPASAAWPMPEGMTAIEAATIPVAFLTALYSLETVAALRAGERVLIHAAAGGVGLAAVQIARRIGAEVFVTAGSDAKRDYLRGLGVTHVMNSRSTDFAGEVLAATGGEGIDVVLNSLTGEAISKGLSILRPGGRFLEIGKTELLTAEEVEAINPGTQYSTIFLGEVCARDPGLISSLMRTLETGFASGDLKPLPNRVFGIADVAVAFRFMAQARHIGKVVVDHAGAMPLAFRDGAQLVTGGLGALGVATAQWLVHKGARDVVLVGRSEPGDSAKAAIQAMENDGAAVTVVRGDLSDGEVVHRLVSTITADRPLVGVFHAAGIVDDGIVGQQTAERARKVLAAKADGAWHLHEATRRCDLDHFVMFSGAASLFGSPGQSTYAAANAYLDGLAHYRRGHGLAAQSINWGPWADIGMAARVSEQDRQRWKRLGVNLLAPEEGTALLGRAMQEVSPQVAAMVMDWSAVARELAETRRPVPGILKGMVAASEDAPGSTGLSGDGFATALSLPGVEDRRREVEAVLRRHVAHVLQLPASDILSDAPLGRFGLDSLMAVEFRNLVQADAGRTLPLALFLADRPLAAVAAELTELLTTAEAGQSLPAVGPTAAQGPDAAALLADLAHLSPEEMDALLSDMLRDSASPSRDTST